MSDATPVLAEVMKAKAELQRLGRPIRKLLIPRTIHDQILAQSKAQKVEHPTFGDLFGVGLYARGEVPVMPYASATDAMSGLAGHAPEDRIGLLLPNGTYLERSPYQTLAEISQFELRAKSAATRTA